jgi:hypothetical protein
MSPIRDTTGYLVADSDGREVGLVECPLYGQTETRPDSVAVCSSGRLFRRHYIVREGSIRAIDRRARSIRLGRPERELQRFL